MKPFRASPAFEQSAISLFSRIRNRNAEVVTRAMVSSIALKVFDTCDASTPISTTAPSKTDVVFDTLQTGGGWTVDATGYNFRYETTAAQLPHGNRLYRFEFIFTMTDGSTLAVVFEVPTINLYGS